MPVPEVVAVDTEQGWLLMKDGGISLRSLFQGDGDWRDLYLVQWLAFGPPLELLADFDLVHVVGMVNRALTWHTFLGMMPAEERSQEAAPVPGWLHDFLRGIN